jgi:hypothetical protein
MAAPDLNFSNEWGSLEEKYGIAHQNLSNFAREHFGDLKGCEVKPLCDRGDPGYAILAQAEGCGRI